MLVSGFKKGNDLWMCDASCDADVIRVFFADRLRPLSDVLIDFVWSKTSWGFVRLSVLYRHHHFAARGSQLWHGNWTLQCRRCVVSAYENQEKICGFVESDLDRRAIYIFNLQREPLPTVLSPTYS